MRANTFQLWAIVITALTGLFLLCQIKTGKNQVPEKLSILNTTNMELQPYYRKLCQLDRARAKRLRDADPAQSTLDDFHSLVMDTFSTVCLLKTRLGGKFLKVCGYIDGQKYLCMDGLAEAIGRGECLVYSFGVAADWTFEDAVAEMGCKVFAFDPTVDYPETRSNNIKFKKQGVAAKSSADGRLMTLGEFFAANGHSTSTITYLKMDVEGSEIS